MIAKTPDELKTLDDLTERILARLIYRIRRSPTRRIDYFDDISNDAINWADLHCCDASFQVNYRREETNRVLIEEASPSSQRLAAYLYRFLKRCGYENIEISIEW